MGVGAINLLMPTEEPGDNLFMGVPVSLLAAPHVTVPDCAHIRLGQLTETFTRALGREKFIL